MWLLQGKKESFRKPWQTPVASLEKAQDIKVRIYHFFIFKNVKTAILKYI